MVGASVALSAGAGLRQDHRPGRAVRPRPRRPRRRSRCGRIVALTFTNKAARELRERIRRECRARQVENGGDPAHWRGVDPRSGSGAGSAPFTRSAARCCRKHAVEAGDRPRRSSSSTRRSPSALRDQALDGRPPRTPWPTETPTSIELAVDFGLVGRPPGPRWSLLANRSSGDIRKLGRQRRPKNSGHTLVRSLPEKRSARPLIVSCVLRGVRPALPRPHRRQLRSTIEKVRGQAVREVADGLRAARHRSGSGGRRSLRIDGAARGTPGSRGSPPNSGHRPKSMPRSSDHFTKTSGTRPRS